MDEPGSAIRRSAVVMMAIMVAVWVALYFFSFTPERGQASPEDFSFQGQEAAEGRKVFQAYNCMGCHTIVGNGAYFAPDLTDIHERAGPAWLAAYLPSAGTWPTEGALALRVRQMAAAGVLESDSVDDYYQRYPGARERVEGRGGQGANMPDLTFRPREVDALIAFLAYTSAMDNEGWPPEVRASEMVIDRKARALREGTAISVSNQTSASTRGQDTAGAPADDGGQPSGEAAGDDPVAAGEQLAASQGCQGCHSTDRVRKVGPGWGSLYGSERTLNDGSSVRVDEDYLHAAIVDPDRQVPEGYAPGMMPSFQGQLDEDEVDALVAYIRSLGAEEDAR